MKSKSDFRGYELSDNTSLEDVRYILEGDNLYFTTNFLPVAIMTDGYVIKIVNSLLAFACRYKREDIVNYLLSLNGKSHYDEDIEILKIEKPEYYEFVQKVIKKRMLLTN